MRIQIKLTKYFHPNIHSFSQNVIQNQTKQRKKSTPLTSKNHSIAFYHISTLEHVREQVWIWRSLMSVLATAPYCAKSKTVVSTAWNVCNIHRWEKKKIISFNCRKADFSVLIPTKRILAQCLLLLLLRKIKDN